MAGQIAEAYVQIIPTTDGIASGIQKNLGGAGESGGRSFSGGFLKTATKFLAAAGVGKLVKDSLNLGGELEQNLGGVSAVFGDFAGTIETHASAAYRNMGLSASDYMATANKMGSLFQGSGIEQQKALSLTTASMQRAADVASVMGLDTSAAMEAIAGAAKGNFTMMDNLGVAMNATTLEAYALEKGMNFKWNTASNAEKTELALQMFMDRTSQYAGNFAREAEGTFSGSLGQMQAAAQNLMASLVLGKDIHTALSRLTSSVVAFAKNLLPMLVNIIGGAPQIIVELLSGLGPELLTAGLNAILQLGRGLAQALPQLITTITTLIPQMVSAFLTLLPQLIPVALQIINALALGLVQAIPQLIQAIPPLITQLVDGIVQNVPVIIEAGVQLFMGLVQALPEIGMALVEAAPDIVMALIQGLLSLSAALINGAVQLFTGIVEGLKQVGPQVIESAKQHVTNTINKIKGMGPQLLAAVKDFAAKIPEGIKSAFGAVNSAIAQIGSSIVSGIKNFASQLVSAGKNLILGLANGIKQGIANAVAAAREAGRSVIAAAKAILGIHSPSTVFADIGENITLGLAKGITEDTKPVTNAIDNVAAMATAGIESGLAVNAALGVRTDAEATGDLRTLISVVNALSRKIDNIGVYLDGDRVVGGIVDRMDNALGNRAVLVGRGQA